MIKVCHVTSAHMRYDVRIFEKECVSLANNGYNVTLVVNDAFEDEIKQGVNICSTHFVPSNRKERMFTSMKMVLKKALEADADIYHLHDPELLQLVKKLKRKGKKVIFDAHEDTSEQIMDKAWIPLKLRKAISYAYSVYSKNILNKVDGIITVTPAIVDKMRKYNTNVELVTNYPIIQSKHSAERKISPYLFFAGGIGRQWCHDKIIKAIEDIEGIKYIMAGPIADDYFEELKMCPGWGKVEYLGRIPHEKVESYYREALAGMAVNESTQAKGEGTLGNTKLFEIMAAEVPVICTDYRLWKKIMDEEKCGLCVDTKNISSITDAIVWLMKNSEASIQMGKNGRRAVENKFNWNVEAKKMINMYRKL